MVAARSWPQVPHLPHHLLGVFWVELLVNNTAQRHLVKLFHRRGQRYEFHPLHCQWWGPPFSSSLAAAGCSPVLVSLPFFTDLLIGLG